MLYEIMKSIKNFFLTGEIYIDNFTIKDGSLSLPFVEEGTYILIKGSKRNDGVYKYPDNTLEDETFRGEIAILSPPRDFIKLCDEISEFNKKMANIGPYASESFGGYSYTIEKNANGSRVTWQDAFRTRLNTWRKI